VITGATEGWLEVGEVVEVVGACEPWLLSWGAVVDPLESLGCTSWDVAGLLDMWATAIGERDATVRIDIESFTGTATVVGVVQVVGENATVFPVTIGADRAEVNPASDERSTGTLTGMTIEPTRMTRRQPCFPDRRVRGGFFADSLSPRRLETDCPCVLRMSTSVENQNQNALQLNPTAPQLSELRRSLEQSRVKISQSSATDSAIPNQIGTTIMRLAVILRNAWNVHFELLV
jgi:hypothetical protein